MICYILFCLVDRFIIYFPFYFVSISIKDNGDRSYLVQVGQEFEEIKLGVRVISGLIHLNELDRRNNVDFDKSFIKALLISVFSVETIKKSLELNKDSLKFIKGNMRFNQLNESQSFSFYHSQNCSLYV